MADVSHDAWSYEAPPGIGGLIHVCGPAGEAVSREYGDGFRAELKRLLSVEEGLELHEMSEYHYPSIRVPDSEHFFWARSVLGEDPFIDTDLWESHTVLTYSTVNNHYEVLCERNKIDAYRDPKFCAAVVVDAVKAHRAAGFTKVL